MHRGSATGHVGEHVRGAKKTVLLSTADSDGINVSWFDPDFAEKSCSKMSKSSGVDLTISHASVPFTDDHVWKLFVPVA